MDKAQNLASAARANLNSEMQGYADALQRIIDLARNGAML